MSDGDDPINTTPLPAFETGDPGDTNDAHEHTGADAPDLANNTGGAYSVELADEPEDANGE